MEHQREARHKFKVRSSRAAAIDKTDRRKITPAAIQTVDNTMPAM